MSNRIITISRQFGSGGRTIGKLIAEKLNIPCYDRELITKISEESGFAEEYIEERGEQAPATNWISNTFSVRSIGGMIHEDNLWASQCKVLFDIAEQGPCVIIGRCADHVLKDRFELLTAFIHAPLEKRAERIVNVYGESDVSIQKRINDKDKRRKAYYQLYTDNTWGAAENFDVCLDSAAIGIERCAEIIVDIYSKEK